MKQNYIPTINISSLVNKDLGSKESLKIIKKIEKACVEVGFFQAEDGIRDAQESRGLGDVYKRQHILFGLC